VTSHRHTTHRAPVANAPKSLGAGAEAAEGLHSLQQSGEEGSGERATHRTGASEVRTEGASPDDESGSEPLPRNREHVPSYGGAGGAPRTSSDTRELPDARGDQGSRVAHGEQTGGSADGIPDDPGRQPINPT
jgi:hypothetical protein